MIKASAQVYYQQSDRKGNLEKLTCYLQTKTNFRWDEQIDGTKIKLKAGRLESTGEQMTGGLSNFPQFFKKYKIFYCVISTFIQFKGSGFTAE